MKLVQAAKTFKTNADFTSQDFTIGDVSVVIEILRNKLYRHKVRTLVQEYVSNARDAMREAGNTKDKIEITLPTMFQPTFKVRDFGIGINPDRMYNVFIKYASSTKRDSNNQTVGFGIGAKSAWSYTESFTVVTYIDGVQRTYVAHIGANNNGRLDFLGESATDAANGTEIQIPVSPKDAHDFRRAAFRATYFWNENEKPVFKNVSKDDVVPYIQGDMIDNLEINNKLPDMIVPTWGRGLVLSIDGIPYFIEENMMDKIPSLDKLSELVVGRLVLHVKTGDIEVSASREEVSDSKHTIDSLEKIAKKMLTQVDAKIKKEFAGVKTPFDHLSVYMKLKDLYNLNSYRVYGNFTVNGDNKIESELFQLVKAEFCTMPSPKFELAKEQLNKSRRRYGRRAAINADWFNHLFFVDGTETAIITNYRIKSYLQSNPAIVVFTQTTDPVAFGKLKTGLGLKDLKTINFTKPARKTREIIKIERTKQTFCLHRMDRFSHQAHHTTLDSNTQKWLYVERTDNLDKHALFELNQYLQLTGEYKVCALGKDTIRRVKDDKNFTSLESYLKNYKVKAADIQSLKYHARKNTDMIEQLKKLKGLTSKLINNMIAEYATHTSSKEVPSLLKKAIGQVDEVEQFKTNDIALKEELQKYPLLNNINWPWGTGAEKVREEIVTYMNAK
jgi:Histidine kinase-, DNA gyrase B-, and HSP90-like ATPase